MHGVSATHALYEIHGATHCPVTHPYALPELTQQVAYTITKDDGAVAFSPDLMPGMTMPGGTTFHADYMEGWDPQVRATWERERIGKLLNCADGELGDGTMLKRGEFDYRAASRSMVAPAL